MDILRRAGTGFAKLSFPGRRAGPLALALAGAVGCTAVPDGAVKLAEEGKPAAVIVVPASVQRGATEDGKSMERQAAELLQFFIERISGAALPIVSADEIPEPVGNLVIVGDAGLAAEFGVNEDGLGPGGIRLKTARNAVVLLGGPNRIPGEGGVDDGGLRYAAIELLEQLGCRYLWPGETGMVVPRRETVEVGPLDISYTPQVRSRFFRAGNRPRLEGWNRAEIGIERLGMTSKEWWDGYERSMGNALPLGWGDWQRLGGDMPRFGHAGAGFRDGERYLESNPEWFAMQADGTRWQADSDRWRLCKSNPQLIEHVANDIIRQRNENPDLTLISLDPNDGSGVTGWCQCDTCKALDPPHAPSVRMLIFPTTENRAANRQQIDHPALTDRLLYYWNSIAERVTRVHPDLVFGVSAYSRFSTPPVEREIHPNLLVRYVSQTVDDWEEWHKKGVRRMYWRPNILLRGRAHGKLIGYVDSLAKAANHLADRGLMQTDFDANTHHWSVAGLNYYATARLNWNPGLSGDEIISDFAVYGFGAGASYIERYFRRVDPLIAGQLRGDQGVSYQMFGTNIYTSEIIRELRDLLNAAERAVAGDPASVERIAFLRLGLNFTELQNALAAKSRRADAGETIDRELARRLVDLNCLVLRDIIYRHNQAIHVPMLVQVSGTFSRFRSIGGATVTPSDTALLERIGDPRYGLTGRENSLDEMMDAFGL